MQKANEFLMPVAGHAAPDQRALEDVQSREQRSGAVALVVVGHAPARPGLIGSPGRVAVERLNFDSPLDREHHRRRRRIEVQADDARSLAAKAGPPTA